MYSVQMKNIVTSFIGSAFVLTLAACGGGGGAGSGVTPERTATAQAVQLRALKGMDVTVTPFVIPGTPNNQPTTVEIRVTKPELIDSVSASNGVEYENPANLPLALTLVSPGVWRLDWPKSAPAGSALLLKFTLKTGDIIETAVGDFTFK